MCVRLAAFLQYVSESVEAWVRRIRIQYLLPLVSYGGRSMYLLRNEQWIDASVIVPADEIVFTYDALKHTIRSTAAPTQMNRCPWISVVANGVDISDFFTSLRISAGITDAAALMLYAHQKGVLYTRDITVISRDGSTTVMNITDHIR